MISPGLQNEYPVEWDDVAQSIADGEAVLVLGPDAIPMYRAQASDDDTTDEPESLSFSQLSRRRILQTTDLSIPYFYQRDNLFLFGDAESKRRALKIVRECARDTRWLPDQELMRQIAAIPFCLVMDINPDAHLYNTFIRYGLSPQFDFFSTKDKPVQPDISMPSAERPLLYNLCGSIEKLDSQILDYNDLFDLLRNMLGDLGVPQALRNKLQEADRFILLGLHLERWYFQLLVHYLNKLDNTPFNNPTRSFCILSDVKGDTREFVMRQFNLECISPSRKAFDALYTACKKQGILRKMADPYSAVATQIRIHVEKNELSRAFALLEEHILPGARNELTILKSRFNEWQRQSEHKIADSRDLDVEINKIRYTLLTFAAQITDD